MELKGKYEFLSNIIDKEEQVNKIKNTVYDVANNIFDVLYNLVGCDKGLVCNLLWRCGVYDMIKSLEELIEEPSTNAQQDAIDEKMERQKQDLLYLLKIMEKMDLDFIFIK